METHPIWYFIATAILILSLTLCVSIWHTLRQKPVLQDSHAYIITGSIALFGILGYNGFSHYSFPYRFNDNCSGRPKSPKMLPMMC